MLRARSPMRVTEKGTCAGDSRRPTAVPIGRFDGGAHRKESSLHARSRRLCPPPLCARSARYGDRLHSRRTRCGVDATRSTACLSGSHRDRSQPSWPRTHPHEHEEIQLTNVPLRTSWAWHGHHRHAILACRTSAQWGDFATPIRTVRNATQITSDVLVLRGEHRTDKYGSRRGPVLDLGWAEYALGRERPIAETTPYCPVLCILPGRRPSTRG